MDNIMLTIQKILNYNKLLFKNVEIQQEEANTDKFIKIKLIEVLSNNNIDAQLYNKDIHGYFKVKPDLVIKLDTYLFFEIKTSKKNNGILPGSSIQQINLLQPTIFWDREINEFKVDYYFTFLTGNLPFPDRSPRPTVRYGGSNLSYDEAKIMIDDWKNYLANIWFNSLDFKNNKWFDETIDIFALMILNLNTQQQSKLKNIISNRNKNI